MICRANLLLPPLVVLLPLLAGCSGYSQQANPSFPITRQAAHGAMQEMAEDPRPLDRPLVIVGGFMDPNLTPALLKRQFYKVSGDQRIVRVNVGFLATFDDCREAVIAAVDQVFPNGDPLWTVEVDVIGYSMGGLVARYAWAPPMDGGPARRLHVRRLFTIASPHQGASRANLPSLSRLQTDMRPGSQFLEYLNQADADADYELVCYARLGDVTVGEENTAPPGQQPLWVSRPFLESAHAGAWQDARILADISRRLRSEPPFADDRTPAPLPER